MSCELVYTWWHDAHEIRHIQLSCKTHGDLGPPLKFDPVAFHCEPETSYNFIASVINSVWRRHELEHEDKLAPFDPVI